MEKILRITNRISKVLVWFGGTLIILSSLMVTVEVVMRKLFSISLGGADELSGYAFGIATTLGLAYALLQKAHIRVDAVYNLFPPWLRLVADFVGIVLLAGFAGIVSVMAWQLVADTIAHNSHSITPMRTPLILPQIPWLFGWLFFVLTAILVIIVAAIAVIRGDVRHAQSLLGIPEPDNIDRVDR